MSHLSTPPEAAAVVRVLTSTTQVHILLSRAIGFIIDGRINLAETSFLRATTLLDKMEEESPSDVPTFGSLRAMTVSGMFSFVRGEFQSALRYHETVVDVMPEDPMDLISEDREETAEHVTAFLKLQAMCLARIRKHMRYDSDDFALAGAVAGAN